MKIKWRALGELAAVISVVLSLAFVGLELRINRQVAITESFGSAAGTTVAISGFLASHASTWRRGCASEELSKDEEVIFGSLVQAIDRHFFYRFNRVRDGIIVGNERRWPALIARNRVLWPGFDRKWIEIVQSGGGSFDSSSSSGSYNQIVEEEYNLLKTQLSPDSFDASLCGLYAL